MTTKKARSGSRAALRKEYDLSKLEHPVRGKHFARASKGSKLVRLDPDVAAAFPSAKAVNDALRLLRRVARTTVPVAG